MLIFLGSFIGLIGLSIAAWYDFKEYRIPNQLIAWLFAIGIVFLAYQYEQPVSEKLSYYWGSPYVSVGIGFGIAFTMLIVRLIYNGIRLLLKRETQTFFGGGDMKLLAVLSLFFPMNAYILVVLLACVFILLVEPFRIWLKKKTYFAFAPYMFASGVIVIIFAIINTYPYVVA